MPISGIRLSDVIAAKSQRPFESMELGWGLISYPSTEAFLMAWSTISWKRCRHSSLSFAARIVKPPEWSDTL
jgi:hypothetical protein